MWLQHTHSTFPSTLRLLCALVCFSFAASAVARFAPLQSPHLHSGVVSFPVYHKSLVRMDGEAHKRLARRTLDSDLYSPTSSPVSSPPPPNSGSIPELRSEVITLAEPFGQYFAELQIGTPAKDIAVIMDTGSELMWIQCTPCVECGRQDKQYPIFDPASSSSARAVMCSTDDNCATNTTVQVNCSASRTCLYNVFYDDNSTSSGVLTEETLTFTEANNGSTATGDSSAFTFPQFVFGCGVDNVGVESQMDASGMMGLDRGAYSIISQLGITVFSYCLPNRENNVDVSGYLTFGALSAASFFSKLPALQYTPMIQNKFSKFFSQFYYLNLTGVSLNGQLLNIPAAAFEIDENTGWGGTIIDSGTTLTTFVAEAYNVVIQAFEDYIGASYKKGDLDDNSTTVLCYEVPLSKQSGAPAAPKVVLHFEGSVNMELGTDQLFHLYRWDTTNNYYCVTLASGGPMASGAKNIIGNFQQQNFLVEYDIANSRVGFAATQCSPSTTPTSNAPSLH